MQYHSNAGSSCCFVTDYGKIYAMKQIMKKTFYTLSLVLIPLFLYSDVIRKLEIAADGAVKAAVFFDGKKEVAREIFNDNLDIIKKTGKIPDGIVKQYYESGQLYAEYNYKNNFLDGLTKTYYEDGKIMTEDIYKRDSLNGLSRQYYPSGALKAEENYKNNLRDSICSVFNEDGSIKTVKIYKDGKVQNDKNQMAEVIK